jgi:hypothetical protein
MRRRTFVQWVVCLVIGFLCCPTMSGAAAEGISCTPEPTDMIITYGDLITCKVESNGDSDIFRFSGISGESITIISSNQDGFVQPCIELYNPDGTIAGQGCTWPAYTNRIDVILTQTGSHTILLKDDENDNTGTYALSLERVVPPSPTSLPIQYSESIVEEINPVGDIDIFFFQGSIGDVITVQSSNQDGFVQPCIELYNPDGTIAGQGCTWPAYTNRIDVTLIQTGSHTILLKDDENDNTGAYLIALQCLAGPCVIFPTPDIVGRIEVGGQPFVGAPVILRQPRKLPQETTTDANGEYQFDNILQGSFSIIIKGVK